MPLVKNAQVSINHLALVCFFSKVHTKASPLPIAISIQLNSEVSPRLCSHILGSAPGTSVVLACPPLTQEREEAAVNSNMLTKNGCIINEPLAVAMYNLWILR